MPTVQITRDPFARASLMREPNGISTCRWCGQYRRTWKYYWTSDDHPNVIQRYADGRAFCSVGCYRAYSA